MWWPVSHVLAMAGLVALAVLLRHAGERLRSTELLAWVAVALLLPNYGAEAFGGHVRDGLG